MTVLQDPTVFVLGAGSSQPYGLPTGQDLVRSLSKNRFSADVLGTYSPVAPLANAKAQLDELSMLLRQSGQHSIDAFLERHPRFREIGKRAIAAAIRPAEIGAQARLLGADCLFWHLFPRLQDLFGKGVEGNIGFISFNYDRLAEVAFQRMISASRGMTKQEAAAVFNDTPFIHVYGQMAGPLGFSESGEQLGRSTSPSELVACADSIRVIGEERGSSDEQDRLNQAAALIRGARTVIFLGFGFDELNLKRIGFAPTTENRSAQQNVFASAFGMRRAEISRAKRLLAPGIFKETIEFGDPKDGCIDFIRDCVDL